MVEAVTDHHNDKGHTKAPDVPTAQIHVTDVESKPDPIAVDSNPEVVRAPDST